MSNETVLRLVAPHMAVWSFPDLAQARATCALLRNLVRRLPVTICVEDLFGYMSMCRVVNPCGKTLEAFKSVCTQYPHAVKIDTRFTKHWYPSLDKKFASVALSHLRASSVILSLHKVPWPVTPETYGPYFPFLSNGPVKATHLEIHGAALTDVLSADCLDLFFARLPDLLSYKTFPFAKCMSDSLLLQPLGKRCPKLHTLRCGCLWVNKSPHDTAMALGQLRALRDLEFTLCDVHPLSYVLSELPLLQHLHVKNVCTLDGLLGATMVPHEHLCNFRVTRTLPMFFEHDDIIEYFRARKDKLPSLVSFGQANTKHYLHDL